MGYGIRVLAKGPRACFTRPEMKGERVSYDCITPSAARPTHVSPWPLTCGPGTPASCEAGVSVCPRTCSPRGAGN